MGYDRDDSFPFDFEPQMVQNREENCHHDHNPINLKGNGNIVLPVCAPKVPAWPQREPFVSSS